MVSRTADIVGVAPSAWLSESCTESCSTSSPAGRAATEESVASGRACASARRGLCSLPGRAAGGGVSRNDSGRACVEFDQARACAEEVSVDGCRLAGTGGRAGGAGEPGMPHVCAGLRGLERGSGLAVLSGAEVAVRLRHPGGSNAPPVWNAYQACRHSYSAIWVSWQSSWLVLPVADGDSATPSQSSGPLSRR